MSHLITVVLVIAACWFAVALVVGIVLGTLMRRARALALVHENASRARGARTRALADRANALSG